MRHDDLPADWTSRPLDDASLVAGVVDLLVGSRDRENDSLLVLPCDERRVGLPAPILVAGMDWEASASDRREDLRLLSALPGALPGRRSESVSGAVVAVSSGEGMPYPLAARWRDAAAQALAEGGAELVAFATVTAGHVGVIGGEAVRRVDLDSVRRAG